MKYCCFWWFYGYFQITQFFSLKYDLCQKGMTSSCWIQTKNRKLQTNFTTVWSSILTFSFSVLNLQPTLLLARDQIQNSLKNATLFLFAEKLMKFNAAAYATGAVYDEGCKPLMLFNLIAEQWIKGCGVPFSHSVPWRTYLNDVPTSVLLFLAVDQIYASSFSWIRNLLPLFGTNKKLPWQKFMIGCRRYLSTSVDRIQMWFNLCNLHRGRHQRKLENVNFALKYQRKISTWHGDELLSKIWQLSVKILIWRTSSFLHVCRVWFLFSQTSNNQPEVETLIARMWSLLQVTGVITCEVNQFLIADTAASTWIVINLKRASMIKL